eukprot:s120_g10.t1
MVVAVVSSDDDDDDDDDEDDDDEDNEDDEDAVLMLLVLLLIMVMMMMMMMVMMMMMMLMKVCVLGQPGPDEDSDALLQKIQVHEEKKGGANMQQTQREEFDDSSTSESSENSGAEEPKESEFAKRKPRKKGVPKPPPRRLEDISWLSDLLTELQNDAPASAESAGAGVSTGLGPMPSSTKPDLVQNLLRDGFTLGQQAATFARVELDETEQGEDNDIVELSTQSGLDVMLERENKLVEEAIGATSSSASSSMGGSAAMAKSAVVEENLVASINDFISSGMDPEDAATEAMLSHTDLLGNEAPETSSQRQSRQNESGQAGQSGPSTGGTCPVSPSPLKDLAAKFAAWNAACALSIDALRQRNDSLAKPLCNELSLVLHDGHVIYVHWREPDKRMGRPATLDKEFGVKCIVPVGPLKNPTDYTTAKIVWPSIGITMLRQKGYKGFLRPRVPDPVLRIARMWTQALVARDSGQGMKESDPLSTYSSWIPSDVACLGCGKSAAIAVPAVEKHKQSMSGDHAAGSGDLDTRECVQECPLCLQPFHWSCAGDLVQHGESIGFSFPDDMGIPSLLQPDVMATSIWWLFRAAVTVRVQEVDLMVAVQAILGAWAWAWAAWGAMRLAFCLLACQIQRLPLVGLVEVCVTQKHYHNCGNNHFHGCHFHSGSGSRSHDPVQIHIHNHVHNHFCSQANTNFGIDIDAQVGESPSSTMAPSPPQHLEGGAPGPGDDGHLDDCGDGDKDNDIPFLSPPSPPVGMEALEDQHDDDLQPGPSLDSGSADSCLEHESGCGEESEDGHWHQSGCSQEDEGEVLRSPVPKRRTSTPPPPPQKLRRMTRHISD